jgi:hypothetical protein
MKLDPKWLAFGLTDEQAKGAVIVGWRALIVAHVFWACGWLSMFGIGGGFALASDQRSTDAKLTKILQLQLSERIRSLSYERCLVIGHEQKARKASEIEEWQLQYKQLSGERYPEPGC